MSTIYTDRERTERYDRLRIKKKKYERVYAVAMIAAIFAGLITISDAENLGGFIPYLMRYVLAAANAFAIVLSIYKHDLRISLPTTAFSALLWVTTQQKRMIFFSMPMPFNDFLLLTVVMLVVCVTDSAWRSLSQEEGFPLFEISMAEYESRERNAEKYARSRAEAAGAREYSPAQRAGMNDLLEKAEHPMLAARPQGSRSPAQEQAAAPRTERVTYNPGVMDELILPPHDDSE